MSREKKGFALDFEEPPKTERVGKQPDPLYMGTIDVFLDSGREYAKVNIPREKLNELKNPMQSIKSGLKSAIKRKKADNKVKVITRKDSLYLITKAYSTRQGWKWKVTRKK